MSRAATIHDMWHTEDIHDKYSKTRCKYCVVCVILVLFLFVRGGVFVFGFWFFARHTFAQIPEKLKCIKL